MTQKAACAPQGTAKLTTGGNVVVSCLSEFLREHDGATGAMVWEGEIECRDFDSGGGWFEYPTSVRWYPLGTW